MSISKEYIIPVDTYTGVTSELRDINRRLQKLELDVYGSVKTLEKDDLLVIRE